MRELSLHILDLVQNSITAQASLILIKVTENTKDNFLEIEIEDNGRGMSKEFLKKVRSPFSTTRTTRNVGLGIPLFEAACERCDGGLEVESEEGKGTVIRGRFTREHFDKPPIGRINETISSLLLYDSVDFEYIHTMDDKTFTFNTREIKNMVGDDITKPAIINWIKEYITENLENIGVDLWC